MSPHARQPEPLQDRQRRDEQGEPLVKARQVRRRLRTSTSRPFQERLVDMAAARKEIAAALRVHRAAAAAAVTRRSRDQHEQQVQWPPCDAFFSGHLRDDSPPRYLAPVLPVAPPVVIGGGMLGHLGRSLPALPLGLNLSFHGFTATSVYEASNSACHHRDRPLVKPSPADFSNSPERSSPSSVVMPSQGGSPAVDGRENAALPHPVLAGEGDATSFLGAVDLAATPAYAWRSDILDQGTEGSGCVGKRGAPAGHDGGDVDVASMPDSGWLYDGPGDQGGKQVGGLGAHLDGGDYYHYCHQRDDEDIALPCMEIEGWDGEWFS